MTEIAASLSAQPFALTSAASATAPPAQVEAEPAPARRSRLRRLASAVAATHRASVPF